MLVLLMGGISYYALEMGLSAMIYIPSFIKIDSGIQKLLGGIHIQRDRQKHDLKRLLLFF
jgi:hypothetical protein